MMMMTRATTTILTFLLVSSAFQMDFTEVGEGQKKPRLPMSRLRPIPNEELLNVQDDVPEVRNDEKMESNDNPGPIEDDKRIPLRKKQFPKIKANVVVKKPTEAELFKKAAQEKMEVHEPQLSEWEKEQEIVGKVENQERFRNCLRTLRPFENHYKKNPEALKTLETTLSTELRSFFIFVDKKRFDLLWANLKSALLVPDLENIVKTCGNGPVIYLLSKAFNSDRFSELEKGNPDKAIQKYKDSYIYGINKSLKTLQSKINPFKTTLEGEKQIKNFLRFLEAIIDKKRVSEAEQVVTWYNIMDRETEKNKKKRRDVFTKLMHIVFKFEGGENLLSKRATSQC